MNSRGRRIWAIAGGRTITRRVSENSVPVASVNDL